MPEADYQTALLKLLAAGVDRDQARGFTGVGPQRDDFKVALRGEPAETTASRGEMRSLLLSLKMIELRVLAEQNSTPPLLLLDDVFSELDSSRRQSLAQLAGGYQTFITTTDADAVVGYFGDGLGMIKTGKNN